MATREVDFSGSSIELATILPTSLGDKGIHQLRPGGEIRMVLLQPLLQQLDSFRFIELLAEKRSRRAVTMTNRGQP
ncbi:hypothetical protein [Bradyrhizobium sp. CCBAU 53415]|uniref:hypothetical protein n=1 Tax=Bradyrhizobium sp. CCBAU 53415 TaxID=1325119 RepID=UPI0023067A3D|nr:hypothetical protein [Bradyrhizobium sp. CCBAU 53415]MDA9463149.1 hypothetical protein [Bradyrhizobium sp. CCBAU 53415]